MENDEGLNKLSDQKVIQILGECIERSGKEHLHLYEDGFEEYAYQLRMRLQVHTPSFLERFKHGYDVIVEVLGKNS